MASLDSCGTPPFGLENISPYIASILSPPPPAEFTVFIKKINESVIKRLIYYIVIFAKHSFNISKCSIYNYFHCRDFNET